MAVALRGVVLGVGLLAAVAIATYLFLVAELSWAYGGSTDGRDPEMTG
jgi:hypothetical protein